MRYPVLKKYMPGVPAGTKGKKAPLNKWIFEKDISSIIYAYDETQINSMPEWFEWREEPERITVEWQDIVLESMPPQYRTQATFKGIFTDAGKKLVEQAVNGELYTKSDIEDALRNWEVSREDDSRIDLFLKQWIKERNNGKD